VMFCTVWDCKTARWEDVSVNQEYDISCGTTDLRVEQSHCHTYQPVGEFDWPGPKRWMCWRGWGLGRGSWGSVS
jgi:hypothetical protein